MAKKPVRLVESKPESFGAADSPRAVTVGAEDYQAIAIELERLQQEEQRRKSAIATAAHDMGAPLAVVKGYLAMLALEKLGPLNEQQRQTLQDMQSSCSRLAFYISELLNQGVASTDDRAVNMEIGDIRECVQSVFNDWVSPYESKQVGLQFVAANGIPRFSFAYRRVQQVIASLLDNALKFTPTGGTVTLTLQPHSWERRVGTSPPPVERRVRNCLQTNSVLVTVKDTGLGISPEFHQDIFEAYFTRGCGDVRSGTGLGLAIARQVARAHDGKIWVESSLGKGSKFCFLLPLNSTPRV